ncbi:MAG: molybdopterin converting factor subunit 1 [Gammaproteobacteria bacterium]|nr:molybdopterin converting factor subunit 1 [Gammaproteobacteria bacterium]
MIKLVFFASLREELGCGSLQVEFKEQLRLSDIIKQLEEKKGKHWGEVLGGEAVKIAINKEIALDDELLSDGCEVAFLPPVTGG